ncbi:hypothetical protein NLJ89_g130 [Agrocybe chaxingu]|uniref:Uncharacterized protein n=1 Tax=Agrocybe chaxingu TaxID=84603 RepID=A0A9W8N2F7_9AGAR|nr:hypothetical protein NLJ89_g130 [Agrocybe chaxingu]
MSSADPKGDNSLTNASPPRLPTQKLTAIARLKSFGGSFVNRRKEPPIVFPPPSWELNDDLLGSSRVTPVALAESNFEDPPPPEPISFAKKLRGLIESLPLPGTSSSATTANADTQGVESPSAPPVPPGLDESLVRMLSSGELMNGKLKESSEAGPSGEGSPGVWNILAGLKKDGGKEGESVSTLSTVEEDEDGLMMYAPLEPKDDSQLQLAESETILECVDEPNTSTSKPTTSKPIAPRSGSSKGKSPERHSEQVIEKHIWVPSTTQLSLLTTWWGYRLYLPPAVMVKLNATSLKATARAAMITTALKWLLDKIPMMLVPVQFRPAVTILKRMSPVTSYIGVFIAWRNGVVLTATWVLPVALLPMSWDAGDIYRPIAAPTPEEIAAAQEAAAKAAAEEAAKEQAKVASADKEKQKRSFFRW